MRQLKATNLKVREPWPELIKYKEQAESKRLGRLADEALFDEIRKGNKNAIPKLVDSWEWLIINIIGSQFHNHRSVSIEKMVTAGRESLTKLATRELDEKGRNIFFRFGGWYVTEAILKLLAKQ
jgi:hypothetical protein